VTGGIFFHWQKLIAATGNSYILYHRWPLITTSGDSSLTLSSLYIQSVADPGVGGTGGHALPPPLAASQYNVHQFKADSTAARQASATLYLQKRK